MTAEFTMIPASRKSIGKRRLIYGVGINDADYITAPGSTGSQVRCPIYKHWLNMMKRCYCPKYHRDMPTYQRCSVVEEWHHFMAFRAWAITQDWNGKELDKDILHPGNKIYGPEQCLFVRHRINVFIVETTNRHLGLPVGVMKSRAYYRAQVKVADMHWRSHAVDTPEEAHLLYLEKKREVALQIVIAEDDPRILPALLSRYQYKNFNAILARGPW